MSWLHFLFILTGGYGTYYGAVIAWDVLKNRRGRQTEEDSYYSLAELDTEPVVTPQDPPMPDSAPVSEVLPPVAGTELLGEEAEKAASEEFDMEALPLFGAPEERLNGEEDVLPIGGDLMFHRPPTGQGLSLSELMKQVKAEAQVASSQIEFS
ncbi:hypothetical protein SAMN05421823_11565 [Catalinimonas alkaloidigena]|uniref:Uncharacterized protein n=1 Tax=Catalinimonas alkaloidigena TaxID=1075417 RepID=A0A1G9U2I0_9BACT|nr:hypothetical protein [Catalinimonas alkaloidigena]SDM54118.1 hypothetical protein SAMN05421823_11565 [Catalinimonas alkaloidigena]